MSQKWIVLFISVFTFSCNNSDFKCNQDALSECEKDESKTNIRIINDSNYDFCNVIIGDKLNGHNYGEINSDQNTCYLIYEKAYNYAYVSLFIEEEELIIQPIDYVGETPLGIGYFTYHLNIENRNGQKELTIYTSID
jgi:hypothetical protein